MIAYRVADKNISGEIIDGELIIVDLVRGVYFNSTGAGPLIWQAIVAGQPMDDAIARLADRATDADAFAGAARSWIERLVSEQIIEPCEASAGTDEAFPVAQDWTRLDPPELEKHGDLEDLLMFDPIHDYDELGWPTQTGA